jgi:hypothetical protein
LAGILSASFAEHEKLTVKAENFIASLAVVQFALWTLVFKTFEAEPRAIGAHGHFTLVALERPALSLKHPVAAFGALPVQTTDDAVTRFAGVREGDQVIDVAKRSDGLENGLRKRRKDVGMPPSFLRTSAHFHV